MEVKREEKLACGKAQGWEMLWCIPQRKEILEEVNSMIECHREFKDDEYRKRHLGLLIRKPQYTKTYQDYKSYSESWKHQGESDLSQNSASIKLEGKVSPETLQKRSE